MTVFDMARDLGKLITETEQAEARDKAQQEFLQNEAAVKIMGEYERFQREIEMKMQSGSMSQEEFADASAELKRLGSKVKANPVAGGYIESVNDFNKMLNQVFHIIQGAAWGQLDESRCGNGCCGDGGDCGDDCGCGGHEEDGCSCGCGHNH